MPEPCRRCPVPSATIGHRPASKYQGRRRWGLEPTAFAGVAIYNAPMLIKKTPDIRSSEITPQSVYLNRRDFLAASGAALVAAGCGSVFDEVSAQSGGLTKLTNVKKSSFSTTEKQNTLDEITSYNN